MEKDERTEALIEKIKVGIAKINTSDNYKKYLKTVSTFHQYSARNTMLIFAQNENATQVGGFESWKKLNRYVKRGENGIGIFAPTKSKYIVSSKGISNDDNSVPEDKEIEIIKFRPVYVFDISQTDGEPLKDILTELKGVDCQPKLGRFFVGQ